MLRCRAGTTLLRRARTWGPKRTRRTQSPRPRRALQSSGLRARSLEPAPSHCTRDIGTANPPETLATESASRKWDRLVGSSADYANEVTTMRGSSGQRSASPTTLDEADLAAAIKSEDLMTWAVAQTGGGHAIRAGVLLATAKARVGRVPAVARAPRRDLPANGRTTCGSRETRNTFRISTASPRRCACSVSSARASSARCLLPIPAPPAVPAAATRGAASHARLAPVMPADGTAQEAQLA